MDFPKFPPSRTLGEYGITNGKVAVPGCPAPTGQPISEAGYAGLAQQRPLWTTVTCSGSRAPPSGRAASNRALSFT